MDQNDNKERRFRKEKKNKDRFSVTIIGVVIYSVVLIAVMVGSYVGVKAIFRNYDRKMAEASEEQPAEVADTPEAETTPELEKYDARIAAMQVNEILARFLPEE